MGIIEFLIMLNQVEQIPAPPPDSEDDGNWYDTAYFGEDDGLWHDTAYFDDDDGLWHDDIYF